MKLRKGDLVMDRRQSIGLVLSISGTVFSDDRLVEVLFSKPSSMGRKLVCESSLRKANV